MAHALQKFSKIILLLLAVYLAIQYLLPLILPFLLGAGLAFGAEPLVAFGCQRLRLPRSLSAGLGVSIAFSFLALVVMVLCALTVRELSTLARILPDLETAVLSGMDSLSRWMLGIAQNAPGSIRTVLSRFVTELFSGGAALVDRIISASLDLATGLLSRVPGSALLLGTAIISSFMISAKLPRLKVWFSDRFPKENFRSALDSLTRLKSAVGGWLLAQLKLCGITCVLCAAGLLILRVRHAPLWAVLIALVDAFPILGATPS